MAHYYNLVTNSNGTITFEDVQQICSIDGESVQLVVEDINNGANVHQQFVTYTTPETNEQAIFSQQTFNLGPVATAQLDQRKNVYIIKTDSTGVQSLFKADDDSTHILNKSITGDIGSQEPVTISVEPQSADWLNMQENNATYELIIKKDSSPLKDVAIAQGRNSQNHIIQGQSTRPELNSAADKKAGRIIYPAKSRHSLSGVPSGILKSSLQSGSAQVKGGCKRNSNLANSASTTVPAVRSRSFSTIGTDAGSMPLPQPKPPQARPPIHGNTLQGQRTILSKNPPALHYPEMDQLSERIKQESLKQQAQKQLQQNNEARAMQNVIGKQLGAMSPMSRQAQVGTIMAQKQRALQANQRPNPQARRPISQANAAVQAESPVQPMEVDTPDNTVYIERLQNCTVKSEPESNSSQSYAYLQQVISNPHNTIVQHQIQGHTAKMLVVLQNKEQRLITFDIPLDDCTVQDLLEQVFDFQANISFCQGTTVSLVSDPALGINYIVEAGPGTISCAQDDMECAEEVPTSSEQVKATRNSEARTADENSNSASSQSREPKFIEGLLALCSHCGLTTADFNTCMRCRRKHPENVKAISIATGLQAKKENTVPVDSFYKKNNEQALTRVDKIRQQLERSEASKRGRGRGRPNTRTRLVKEPECLTISSDEEDDSNKSKRLEEGKDSPASPYESMFGSCEESDTILDKEPIITTSTVSPAALHPAFNQDGITGGGKHREDQESFLNIPPTSLHCRTVRIGSYKYVPNENVVISRNGVKFNVPLLEDDKSFVTLEVKYQDIVKVLIHFQKSMPVLFFYTSVKIGETIRELLGMQDPKGPYYDPMSKDHTHKRITLLPEKISDESKTIIKSLFSPNGLLDELTGKEANDILIRASPKDNLQVQNLMKKQVPAATPSSSTADSGIQTITVYPPPPAKGGIAINTEDYLCLGEDQFLNDVIIDFYLKYLTLEILSPEDHNRTHVFSSYFYKRLTSPHAQATDNTEGLTPAAKRHARVQKWTKNVNIFEKDFIVIPINECAHWFLAIICFPGLVGKVPLTNVSDKVTEDVSKTVTRSKKLKEVKLQSVTIGSTTITPVSTITIDTLDDGSERDEAEGDDDEMDMDSDEDEDEEFEEENGQKPEKVEPELPPVKEIVKVPCILIFDSLAGASRSRVVATLRDYLSCEHQAKMGVEKEFSKDTIKGSCPKVPQQSNFFDCGVYVLEYVETFFKIPIHDYTLPIKTLRNWFEEIVVTRKREEISQLLIKLMNGTKGDKTITLPTVVFSTENGKLKPKVASESEAKSSKDSDKKKASSDGENRTSQATASASSASTQGEGSSEQTTKTALQQIIPYSSTSSSSSSDSNSSDVPAEGTATPARLTTSSELMSMLKVKRMARIMLKNETQDDKQIVKKHKGDSFDSCK